ncbi:MAG TPA: DUF72 domain-containing protein [Candidatus Baltobacteraceae bacterium]|nr:DUF72 domain-containing protein [Candidatus Baltobacteraceae bacterium]
MDRERARIGTAGWVLPAVVRDHFGPGASQLERYATRFSCVEINSSFYRPHRTSTYARWAATVPDDFRFALKIPKAITHERRLVDVDAPLDAFLAETAALGAKRDVLLVQLPPSFAYDAGVVTGFFTRMRGRYDGRIACEPRHASWFEDAADRALAELDVARVAADPAVVPRAAQPGGSRSFAYIRLHGSPRMYYDAYDDAALAAVAVRLREEPVPTWCIFDNTAFGVAAGNALRLSELLA